MAENVAITNEKMIAAEQTTCTRIIPRMARPADGVAASGRILATTSVPTHATTNQNARTIPTMSTMSGWRGHKKNVVTGEVLAMTMAGKHSKRTIFHRVNNDTRRDLSPRLDRYDRGGYQLPVI